MPKPKGKSGKGTEGTAYRSAGSLPVPKQANQSFLHLQPAAEKASPKKGPEQVENIRGFGNFSPNDVKAEAAKLDAEAKKAELEELNAMYEGKRVFEEAVRLEKEAEAARLKALEENNFLMKLAKNAAENAATTEGKDLFEKEAREAERVRKLANAAAEADYKSRIENSLDARRLNRILNLQRQYVLQQIGNKYNNKITQQKIIKKLNEAYYFKNPQWFYNTLRDFVKKVRKEAKGKKDVTLKNDAIFKSHPLIMSINSVIKNLKKKKSKDRKILANLRNSLRTQLASIELKNFAQLGGGARKRSVSKKNVFTKTGGSRTRTRKQSRKNRRPKRTMKNRSSLKKLSRHKK